MDVYLTCDFGEGGYCRRCERDRCTGDRCITLATWIERVEEKIRKLEARRVSVSFAENEEAR
jgi:hypothetical protein